MADQEIREGYEVCVLPKERALTFVDHLNSKGYKAYACPGASEHWSVFVENYTDVGHAKRELLSWAQSPFDSTFNKASWERGARTPKQRIFKGSRLGMLMWDPFSITSVIEIICVLFFIGQFINEPWMLETFSLNHVSGFDLPFDIYRLLTPVFLHFGIMHIAFNLVMWEAMARPVERYLGRVKLFSVFISVALVSNVLQFAFMSQMGIFGGLSGAVYGILAYFGLVSKRADCPSGFVFPRGLIAVSLIFIAFGFFTSGTANICHIGGLLLGLAWGYIDLHRRRLFA